MTDHKIALTLQAENPEAVAVAGLALHAVIAALQVAKLNHPKVFAKAGIDSFGGIHRLLSSTVRELLEETTRNANVYSLRSAQPLKTLGGNAATFADQCRVLLAALDCVSINRSPLLDIVERHAGGDQ